MQVDPLAKIRNELGYIGVDFVCRCGEPPADFQQSRSAFIVDEWLFVGRFCSYLIGQLEDDRFMLIVKNADGRDNARTIMDGAKQSDIILCVYAIEKSGIRTLDVERPIWLRDEQTDETILILA